MRAYLYSEKCLEVLENARQEAVRFSHGQIGTENLLLGIVTTRDSRAQNLLAEFGVTFRHVRSATEFIVGRGDSPEIALQYSPRSKKVLTIAEDLVYSYGFTQVTDMILLLALIREGEGIACGILESLGRVDRIQRAVEESLHLTHPTSLQPLFEEEHIPLLTDLVMDIPLRPLRDSLKNQTGFVTLLESGSQSIHVDLWSRLRGRLYLIDFAKSLADIRLRVNRERYGVCPTDEAIVALSQEDELPPTHVQQCPLCWPYYKELRDEFLSSGSPSQEG